jgi:glucosamine kinase
MERVLGIDGGGTKTEVVVADRAGCVLHHSLADGIDPTKGVDWEKMLARLAAAIGPVERAVLGLPFHGEIAKISDRQTVVARSIFGPGATVLNDVAVAFEGALAGRNGVLVLAGTGSMAWARGPLGTHRVGGWGDVFGDEGSAFWIGRAALGRISQVLDGRRADQGFAAAMLAQLRLAPGDLIRWTYGLTPPRPTIAGLAALVSDLSRNGDPDAISLMTEAGEQLATLGLTAGRLCGTQARWSFAGGAMADPTLRAVLTDRMGSPPVRPVLSPVGGAVLAAARAAGWETDTGFFDQLQKALVGSDQARSPNQR